MRRAWPWLLPLLLCVGCFDDELDRSPSPRVELSSREPGPGCQPLESLEVRSGPRARPSGDALRAYAGLRGANYVLVDIFRIYDEPERASQLTRAQLFRCPEWATARY